MLRSVTLQKASVFNEELFSCEPLTRLAVMSLKMLDLPLPLHKRVTGTRVGNEPLLLHLVRCMVCLKLAQLRNFL
jgi:hypothetical protein